MLTYAGIGSRNAPAHILFMMELMAELLAPHLTLNSGAADGADSAFEAGAIGGGGQCNIFLPWAGFNNHPSELCPPKPEAFAIASVIHPAWKNLSLAAQKLHARNIHQVVGWSMDEPVEFIVCWTPDGCEHWSEYGKDTGGTGTAICFASMHDIPVINLKNETAMSKFSEVVSGLVR